MAHGGMQEVELLDGDDRVTAQPETPERPRRHLWWIAAGAAAVAVSLIGVQLVVDAREDAAVERLAEVPGVFPPLGDGLEVVRTVSAADMMSLWSSVPIGDGQTAGLVVAQDGSQSFAAIDQRSGETLWATPLLGPHPERAAARGNSYGGQCQSAAAPGERATVAVCLATDGFVRYDDTGTEDWVPATSSRVVVLDTGDGHVISEWVVQESAQLAVVDGAAVVGARDERGLVIVAYDVRTGDERWRYEDPVPPGDGAPPPSTLRYWGLSAAGDGVAVLDGDQIEFLSATGSPVREDLRASTSGAGFGTDPATGVFWITTYSGASESTTLLAADLDPADDVVVPGALLPVSVDDGSLPGVVLTARSHAHAWDRDTGEELWESDLQPGGDALVIRGRVYLTTSTEVAAVDGRTGEVVWRTPLPDDGAGRLATDGRDLLLLSVAYDDSDDDRGVTSFDLATGDQTGRIPYPEGVSDLRLQHGLLLGWSNSTEEIIVLE